MRPITRLASVLKWFGLGIFWAIVLVMRPNVALLGCNILEAAWGLLPGTNEECTFFFGFRMPFLEFSDDGTASWGWTWGQTSSHIALWLVCLIGSNFIWRKWREWSVSRKKTS